MNRELIEIYAQGGPILERAVAGLDARDFTAFPVPGTWSIIQIIGHLLDSDLIATHRMRRIIAEELPLLISYDETRFAERLSYDKVDPVLTCAMFALNRRMTAELLRLLPDEAFLRAGIHSQRGKVTLGGLVRDYCEHLDHHLAFIFRKRELLGKPVG